MKLSETLIDIGRPVAYFPRLRRLTGSTTATIFLCQFLYWFGKGADPEGWIYKTSDEIEEETGLSYEEQKTARRNLRRAGLLKERYARIEHTMYFMVDIEALNKQWETYYTSTEPMPRSGTSQPLVREHGIAMFANEPLPCSLNELHRLPETTAIERAKNLFSFESQNLKSQNQEQEQNLSLSKEEVLIYDTKKDADALTADALTRKEINELFERELFINIGGQKWDSLAALALSRGKAATSQFIAYWRENGGEPRYWSPERMITMWPQAFKGKKKLVEEKDKWEGNWVKHL